MWVPRCIVAAISMLVLTATPAVLIVEGTCHCADVCAQIIVTDFMMISHLVNVGWPANIALETNSTKKFGLKVSAMDIACVILLAVIVTVVTVSLVMAVLLWPRRNKWMNERTKKNVPISVILRPSCQNKEKETFSPRNTVWRMTKLPSRIFSKFCTSRYCENSVV